MLNSQQQKAVEAIKGRVLILAGAGSGKTRVLTTRMGHLIQNRNVSPRSILGLTFTNKAAAEMRHRLAGLVASASAELVTLCTFHSFCMQILRSEIHRLGYTGQFSLYDENDVQRLLNLIARDILDHGANLPSLAPTIHAITSAKNKGIKPQELPLTGSKWHDQFAQTVYQRLHDSLRAYNAVDFDHLIWLTVELFEKHPDVLEKYQERYLYIMIDEYQDTNPIQYRLAALLAAKYQNLCVVGDDDQSIYGWRGAEVRNILEFDQAVVIKLEQNFRSTNNILKAANAVISNNKERHPKALWSTRGDGEQIEVFHAPNEVQEAQGVANRIARLREKQKLRWSDFAILYRSNLLSRQFEIALMQQSWKDGDIWKLGIPYRVFGGVEFYERKEVRDLFAYLRAIVNPLDQEALLRIINQPRRGIGESTLDALTTFNRLHNVPLWDVLTGVCRKENAFEHLQGHLNAKSREGLSRFVEILDEAKIYFDQKPLPEAMQWLIEKVEYQRAIREEVKSEKMRAFKLENIQGLVSSAGEYAQKMTASGQSSSLQDFIASASLQNHWEGSKSKDGCEDKVNLMTFHSAKGLEFNACYLVGMEDHIIPHEKSVKESGIEEERRLMYVGITRAMNFLTISMAQQRKRLGKECVSRPSRFLFEIPNELLKVSHWHQIE